MTYPFEHYNWGTGEIFDLSKIEERYYDIRVNSLMDCPIRLFTSDHIPYTDEDSFTMPKCSQFVCDLLVEIGYTIPFADPYIFRIEPNYELIM